MARWSKKSKLNRKQALKNGDIKVNCKIYDIPTKEDLDFLYNEKLMTMVEIGKLMDTSNVTVRKWMRDYNIPLKSHAELLRLRHTNKKINLGHEIEIPPKDDILFLYEDRGYSTDMISDIMDVCPKTVQNWFRKLDIPFSLSPSRSLVEQELYSWITSIYSGDINCNVRGIVSSRKEIDIHIPDRKIAIEMNGIRWHVERMGKDKNYHLEKTEKCLEKGIQLFHVLDTEWALNKSLWKSVLKNALGLSTYIGARDLIVDPKVGIKESNLFLGRNHLQGPLSSPYRYGLRSKGGELISLMTFGKPRFNKNYEYELIRFCTKKGYSVHGGASRLLHHFRKNNQGSIISYANRRWSNGDLYRKLGFSEKGLSGPAFHYVDPQFNIHNRVKYQKHKLPKLLKSYNPDLTADENMKNNGFDKIWDCGNYIFELY